MAKRGRRLANLSLLLLLLAGLAIAGRVAWQQARLANNRMGTAARLQMIMLALNGYYQANGCYPPQYLTDREGKPAHSWRVLLLPYLDKEELFRRYSFDEPWNGPRNRLLATEMPEEYRSPFVDSRSTTAQYVGIVGKDTPWRGTIPLRREDVQRPEGVVVCFVEAANSDINWMEPRDIPFEQASQGINAPGGGGIQSNYSDALPAQMLFIYREWVPVHISPEDFGAMLTIARGKDKTEQNAGTNPVEETVTGTKSR